MKCSQNLLHPDIYCIYPHHNLSVNIKNCHVARFLATWISTVLCGEHARCVGCGSFCKHLPRGTLTGCCHEKGGGGVCVILFKNRGYWLTFSYPGRHRCSTQLFTWKVTEIVVSRTENEGFSPTHGRPVSCLKCMRMLDCRFQTNHNTVQALSPVIQSWKKCCRSEVSEAI